MKKLITILITALLLASGMQVTLDRHYCGGKLADVKISVTGKMASCGMEEAEHTCPDHPIIKKECCEDLMTFYSITSKYFPEFFKLTHPNWTKNYISSHSGNFIASGLYHIDSLARVLPPCINFRSGFTQPEICVFRI